MSSWEVPVMVERERMIAALKAAFVEGRLTKEEFDLRVSQALAIYAELDAITADIPAAPPAVTAQAELAREAANKKMIRQGTAGVAGLTFVLVTALLMPHSPALAAIVGLLLTCFVTVLTAGLLTLLSWAMDRRSGAQGAGGAGGDTASRQAAASRRGRKPELGQDPPGRADIVTKSRAHHGSKNVHGPCLVVASSLLPLDGAARPPGLAGA
jgi:Domain of unknown function (DUF1707)